MIRRIIIIFAAAISLFSANGKQLNDKLLNRPYADNRAWHLGFSIGVHTQDLSFTHSGVTENGESWFMEQPSYSPGFCVNGLIDLRLNTYFNVRFTPGLYFGNKVVKMLDTNSGNTASQNIKSTMIVLPVDLKFSAVRYRNCRPYVLGGVMPSINVGKSRSSDLIQLKPFDCYLSVGFGCDFYLPFFKLIPEVKFCFGLSDLLRHERKDLSDDPSQLKYTNALSKATSKMIVFTFYFE